MLLLLAAGGIAVPIPSTDITAPTNLQLVTYSHLNANLRWNPSVRGVWAPNHYRMYVNSVWDGNEIPWIPNDLVVTYYLNPLTPNTAYALYVTAVDQQGIETGPSNTVNFTTPRNSETLRWKRSRGYYG